MNKFDKTISRLEFYKQRTRQLREKTRQIWDETNKLREEMWMKTLELIEQEPIEVKQTPVIKRQVIIRKDSKTKTSMTKFASQLNIALDKAVINKSSHWGAVCEVNIQEVSKVWLHQNRFWLLNYLWINPEKYNKQKN